MRNRKPIPDNTRIPNSRLTVICQSEPRRYKSCSFRRYLCHCDCGKTKAIDGHSLKSGKSKSCGCLRKEQLSERLTKHGHSIGGKRSPEHRAWHGMQQRCNNPKNPKYHYYGGRGIQVCNRWQGENGFANFLADMGTKPSPEHSIGRINNNEPYSPENCRWETTHQQANNTRGNHLLSYEGKTQNLTQWAKETGIPYNTLVMRIKRGWPEELALTTPVKIGQKVRK